MASIASSDPPEVSPTQSDDSRQPSLDPQTAAMLGVGASQSKNMRSAMEIVSGSFPPFDNRTKIIEPFQAEQDRDADFRKDVNHALRLAILKTQCWLLAQTTQENGKTEASLEQGIREVIEKEKEQEQTREQVASFVNQMRAAISALGGMLFL